MFSSFFFNSKGIMDEIKKWNSKALELFAALLSTDESVKVQSHIDEVKSMLLKITTMIHELSKQSESSEDIGDSIERELSGMDKAIEEAASKIEVKIKKKYTKQCQYNFLEFFFIKSIFQFIGNS